MPPFLRRSTGRPVGAARFLVVTGLALSAALFAPALADPPPAPPRAVAEWEPAYGTLIRWPLGISFALVRELAEEDSVYVLCETQAAENSARSAFQNNGVDLAHCRFLRIGTYSHWTRDWGPHAVFDGSGRLGITDPIFDGYPWVPPAPRGDLGAGDGPEAFLPAGGTVSRFPREPGSAEPKGQEPEKGFRGYEEDDAVNAQLAARLGRPNWPMPAYCTGGNFMTDGHGRGFSSTQMLNENRPLMDEAQFRACAAQYMGIDAYAFLQGTEDLGIQHIDCWAKLLDEETILVKRVPPWHEEYPRIEQNLQILGGLTNCYGRPYRIMRIDTPPYNGYDVAAYTNSLILNRKVLVPLFGISGDAAALEVYRTAMPGYEVLGFAGSWYYYDALHCRTMGIFDDEMLIVRHRRLDAEMPPLPEYRLTAWIDDRSEAGLFAPALAVFWRRQGDPAWQSVPLTPLAAPDSFEARIPGQFPGTTVEYYLSAEDLSGRRETLPRTAPAGFYSFLVAADPAGAGPEISPDHASRSRSGRLRLWPNPARGSIEIFLPPGAASSPGLCVFDATGRTVRRLRSNAGSERASNSLEEAGLLEPAGSQACDRRIRWDGRSDTGALCPAGVYWIGSPGAVGPEAERLIILR